MNNKPNVKKLILLLVLFVVSLIALTGLFWLYSHSTVSITLPSGGGDNGTVVFRTKSTSEAYSVSGGSLKKIVKRGEYTITILTDSGSDVRSISTSRFLGETKIQADLKAEKSRQFIGDNPRTCLNTVGSNTISYDCSGSLLDLGLHIPPTASTPTYFKSLKSNYAGSEGYIDIGDIEGVVSSNNETYVLALQPEVEGFMPKAHVLYKIETGINSISTVYSKDFDFLNPSKSYVLAKTTDGKFVIYDAEIKEIFKGDMLDSFTQVNVDNSPSGYRAISIDSNQNGSMVYYTEIPKDFDSLDTAKLKSKLVLTGENNESYDFDMQYSSFRYCGDYYCGLDFSGNLDIYDKNMDKIYTLFGVNEFLYSSDKLLIVLKDGISEFDIKERKGFIAYTFGDYIFNKIIKTDRGNVVSVSSGTTNYALLLSDNPLSFPIDKAIYDLDIESYINKVSVYENTIFISPELGELEESPSGIGLDYNQETKSQVFEKIKTKLSILKINENEYTIKINNL